MKDLPRSDIQPAVPVEMLEPISATTLFREHAAFVASFLSRLGAHRADLDDLVQEVFLIVHRKGGYVPGSARPTTWLAAIALHVVENARRSKRRSRVTCDHRTVEMAVDECLIPSEMMEGAEEKERFYKALDSLEVDIRAVLVLFELDGESCAAIAAGLGIPIGTVYSRLSVARRRFRDAYARCEPTRDRVRMTSRFLCAEEV